MTLIILLAVVSAVYVIFVGQIGNIVTGFQTFGFLFVVGHAVFISMGLLLYGGRRWRFFFQSVLFALLIIPTYGVGTPFDVLTRLPIVTSTFFADIIFNSFYDSFRKKGRLLIWAILVATIYWIMNPFFVAFNMLLFYPPQLLKAYVTAAIVLSPITVIESVVGGYFGYKIYLRINRIYGQ